MSAANFFQPARGARDVRPIGFIGQFYRTHDFRSVTGVNSNPQAKQVTTVSVHASPDASTLYSVTLGGVTASFTTDASGTQAELGAGLVAAINAKPGIRSQFVASYTGGTLTLTGVWPGVSGTFTVNSADTTNDLGTPSDSTSAADASVVNFGRVCISDGTVTDEGNLLAFEPDTTNFSAQVITITVTTGAAATFTPWVNINGKEYIGDTVVHDTSATVTALAILTEINAIMPTETVVATQSSGAVIFTAEVPGATFEAGIIGAGAASTATKVYTTGPTISTSLLKAMVGISVRREDVENQTVDGDDPAYSANESVEICTRGLGVVARATTETWTRGDECFVSLAAGATAGRIYDTAGTDYVWIPPSRLVIDRSEKSTTTDGLGVIRLDMGA